MFGSLTCGFFVVFLIEEELLCKAQSCIGALCCKMKIVCISINILYLVFEGGLLCVETCLTIVKN
jgi:hypothetical protein